MYGTCIGSHGARQQGARRGGGCVVWLRRTEESGARVRGRGRGRGRVSVRVRVRVQTDAHV